MKKFLSMVMAAAMVVSLVPATAFAASADVKATAKVVDVENYADGKLTSGSKTIGTEAELQLYVTTASYSSAAATTKITLALDNAESKLTDKVKGTDAFAKEVSIKTEDGTFELKADNSGVFENTDELTGQDNEKVLLESIDVNEDKDEVEYVFSGQFKKGWTISFNLKSDMDKISKGKTAKVSVDSNDMTITGDDDLVYAAIEAEGIKASVKDTVDVATEEVATLKDIKIEATVGDFTDFLTGKDAELKLKVNSGFEFDVASDAKIVTNASSDNEVTGAFTVDEDEIVIDVEANKTKLLAAGVDTWTIEGVQVEAVSAKAGATATVKAYLTNCDTVSVEVAKVVDYAVTMSVDEDEDVPVIYSGVDVDNTGLTDDSDHESLEVTVKETFVGAFDEKKDLTFKLPEGVYIADDTDGVTSDDSTNFLTAKQFKDGYQKDEYESITIKRRTITSSEDTTNEAYETTFTMKLVADPNFEGDVVLTMEGDGVETQEVTIAKFVKPFTVEAQQNDLQIDYRNTDIPTSVVIKEAEAGLWKEGTDFRLALDKIEFDDDATATVDSKSGLEIKDVKTKGGVVSFVVDDESDDEPASVTVSGLTLYMDRSLPAGAYDLKVVSKEMLGIDVLDSSYDENTDQTKGDKAGYLKQEIFGVDSTTDCIADVNDDTVNYVAKAGFVNIVTAGREDTDSFTTKVVVPVGESYLISGENKVTIDAPAYINANGYTMLPLRAVSVALGINSNNVLWDQATRTATIMYGSKIISMTYGQKVVYVNAAPIPASTSVEITNDRMFLGLRDLGNALGVTDITWDAATKTATLNGNK